jgi:uncharacterized damage-inducible protein DinB
MTGAPIDIAALKTHFAYTAWASKRIVDAAARLSPEELTRDFGTADKSVLGTLVHVYAGDRVWLARVRGETPGRFIDPERDMKFSVLVEDWPAVLSGWQTFLSSANSDTSAPILYRDLKGNQYATALWQICLHVVNHATHHRGQASGFIRAMGHTPPPLDLIFYYRELAAAAAGQ